MRLLKKKFGQMLKSRRKEMGFKSQAALAEKLDVEQATVGRWETGVFSPEDHHLELLCEILNVEPDYFLDENDSSEKSNQSILRKINSLEDAIKKIDSKLSVVPAMLGVNASEATDADFEAIRLGRNALNKRDLEEAKEGRSQNFSHENPLTLEAKDLLDLASPEMVKTITELLRQSVATEKLAKTKK